MLAGLHLEPPRKMRKMLPGCPLSTRFVSGQQGLGPGTQSCLMFLLLGEHRLCSLIAQVVWPSRWFGGACRCKHGLLQVQNGTMHTAKDHADCRCHYVVLPASGMTAFLMRRGAAVSFWMHVQALGVGYCAQECQQLHRTGPLRTHSE